MSDFIANTKKVGQCVLWTGPKDKLGYGRYKSYSAHRYAYFEGPPPKANGNFVCHTCDNPSCVNKLHLFLADHKANMRDMATKGRHHNTKKTSCPSGHEYNEANTYMDSRGKKNCRKCNLASNKKYRRKAHKP